jgi:hypothetical protein
MVNQHLKDFLGLNHFLNQIMIVVEYENIVIVLLKVANNLLIKIFQEYFQLVQAIKKKEKF